MSKFIPGLGRRIIKSPISKFADNPTNPLVPVDPSSIQIFEPQYAEGIVEDVIVNESHKPSTSTQTPQQGSLLYAPDQEEPDSGYNVGSIKFRFKWDDATFDDKLNWAFPIDSTIEEFPFKGELVVIVSLLNRFYYLRNINIGKDASNQAVANIRGKNSYLDIEVNEAKKLEQTKTTPQRVDEPEDPPTKYFDTTKVSYRLRHWEGDKIIQGRSGQSIRLGSAWKNPLAQYKGAFQSTVDQSPNLLLRIGQPTDPELTTNNIFGRAVEDINNDASSFWMVSNQFVPLRVSTTDIHTSVPDYPSQFAKNQILLNTDQLVINTKTNKILIHSANGYHVFTLRNSTMDVEKDYLSTIGQDRAEQIGRNSEDTVVQTRNIWTGLDAFTDVRGNKLLRIGKNVDFHAGRKVSFSAPKIFIGVHEPSSLSGGQSSSNTQHMVLGDKLVELFNRLITSLITTQPLAYTAAGPAKLNSTIYTELDSIRKELNDILSEDNFVARNNDIPLRPVDRKSILPR